MHRTTISMPASLYQRLRLAAERQGKSLSDIASHLMDRALAAQEEKHLDEVYEGLLRLRGSGSSGITDASFTINQTLYGEQGAWRGQNDEV